MSTFFACSLSSLYFSLFSLSSFSLPPSLPPSFPPSLPPSLPQNCIIPGIGEPSVNSYHSLVQYHMASPTFSETIKVCAGRRPSLGGGELLNTNRLAPPTVCVNSFPTVYCSVTTLSHYSLARSNTALCHAIAREPHLKFSVVKYSCVQEQFIPPPPPPLVVHPG